MLAFYCFLRLRVLDVPLERDEGLYATIGNAIRHGDVLYRDIFDHKPPGSFYILALATALIPPTVLGLHGFLLLWNLLTGLAAASVAGRLIDASAALWTFFFFAIASSSPSVEGFAITSEMLLLLPLTLSLRLALTAYDASAGPTRLFWWLASGGLAGLSFWIKQPAALAAFIVPLTLAVVTWKQKTRGTAAIGFWLLGGALMSVVVVLPSLWCGVLGEFWYWSFQHSLLYSQLEVTDWMGRIFGHVINLGRDVGMLVLISFGGAAVAPRTERPLALLALAFLGLSVVSAFHSPFLYLHYFALLVPALAIAAGCGATWLVARTTRIDNRVGAASAATLALFTLGAPMLERSWYWWNPNPNTVIHRSLGIQGFESSAMLADYIHDHTADHERIFFYGSEPQISFLAQRRDINPFVMVYPLTWPWPRHREFQERAWREFVRQRPTYLLLSHSPFSLVRSPLVDPFLEQQLTAVGRREYHFEAAAMRDADGAITLRFVPPSAAEQQSIFCEIWRRND